MTQQKTPYFVVFPDGHGSFLGIDRGPHHRELSVSVIAFLLINER